MKTVFTIGSEEAKSNTMLMEIGQDYCCYALLDQPTKSFELIRYLSFEDLESEENPAIILNEIKSFEFQNLIVCSAFAQALLSPKKYFHKDQSLTKLIYDSTAHTELKDEVEEWQLMNSYSIPESIYNSITADFPSVRFFHAYTPALKIYNGFVAGDQIDIHFTTRYFRVLVKKEQQLQLAQTYSYKTPLDVVYYLLKICYEFKLEQSEVFLIVSGLVDMDSSMYNELHNYFLNIHFAQAPAYYLPETEHPHYYFTSLYNLAACVS